MQTVYRCKSRSNDDPCSPVHAVKLLIDCLSTEIKSGHTLPVTVAMNGLLSSEMIIVMVRKAMSGLLRHGIIHREEVTNE
jgi:hypothetical protein